MKIAIALGLLLALALPVTAQTPTLDDVVRGVEGAYGKMTDLRGEFTQSALNKSLNQTIDAKGVVYLKKGGKLRWEYAEPTKQEIVSDGKTIWIYTPQLNQVNTGKLRQHFSVRFLNPAQPKDADGNLVLDLTPKQPLPTLARLVLSLDAKSYDVRKAVVYDQFENTVTMTFTKVVVNSGLPDKLFVFQPPQGTATVPLR
jgi:outer membrane lipoprotein carrier protein